MMCQLLVLLLQTQWEATTLPSCAEGVAPGDLKGRRVGWGGPALFLLLKVTG